MSQAKDFDDLQKFCEKFKGDSKATTRAFLKRYLRCMQTSSEEVTLAQTCLQGLTRYVEHRIEKVYQNHADIWTHAGTERKLAPESKVAAMTSENLWVLVSVHSYIPQRDRYHVIDADTQQAMETRKHYKLEPSKLIPLPSFKEYPITKRRIFKPDEWVFAMYPGTTAFYRARVISAPNRKDPAPKYTLEFADDNNKKCQVDALFVAPLSLTEKV
eukprot:CAMPEP_0167758604 /NCGR_PEP_ID=MMETSP0110_2-20121227/10558_1 /TAXON_ID=629695 /ORGANISM="Gymnochlora sp., Strain CCMP2014" /LENGTH=214 /DNA_ID=CAMNT_0007644893 /DNA_START=72 /DNA_END=716 /DNA_ORIENTATION=+